VEDDVAVEMDEETAVIVVNGDEKDAILRGGKVIVSEEDWVGRVVVWDLMRSVLCSIRVSWV
jgi:non-ribosomal peptide synthetase component E (peptide arylation enzyme)